MHQCILITPGGLCALLVSMVGRLNDIFDRVGAWEGMPGTGQSLSPSAPEASTIDR